MIWMAADGLLQAAVGPNPTTWIPTATTQTVGALTVRIQNAPLYARDVQRLFVNAVSGKDIRLLASNSGGGADYFDQVMDNGQYAVFGAVKPGTLTLTLQTSPTGANTWTDEGTISLTVGTARVLAHDTDINISSWYICPPIYNAQTITSTQFSSLLDHHFGDMQAEGFTKVSFDWRPVNYLSVLFGKAAQYNLKVMFSCWRSQDWIKGSSGQAISSSAHHNVPLLTVESNLINDGIVSDVGGGVLMKDHPNLNSYYIADEPLPASARAVELGAMMVKSLDPLHSAASTFAQDTDHVATMAAQCLFLDTQMIDPYPLGNTNSLNYAGSKPSPASDFSHQYPFTTVKQVMTWPDYLQWAQSLRPGVPQEVLFQAFGSDPNVIYWRTPSPKELRAQAFMALARGVRTLNYFCYDSQIGGEGLAGLVDVNDNPTLNLGEAIAINDKVAGWIPVYKNLTKDDNGTQIPYATIPAATTTVYSHDFEDGTAAFNNTGGYGVSATNTFSPAQSGTYTGLATTAGGNGYTRGHHLGFNLCSFPRYSSGTWSVWVNNNGNGNLQSRVGAVFWDATGGTPSTIGPYTYIGGGWVPKSIDLTSIVSNPNYVTLDQLWFGSMTNLNTDYANHYLDDLQLTLTKPAYTPNYQYQGGVVGNFYNNLTGQQYIIVVNTDTVNAKNVTVNIVKHGGGVPVTAQDADAGTVYTLTNNGAYGQLTLNIPAGDGVLLAIDSVTTGSLILVDNSFNLSLANGAALNGQAVSATGLTGNYTVSFAGNNQGQSGSATYTTTGLTFGNFHAVSGGAAVVKAVSGTVNGAPAYEHLQATISATATGTVYNSYLIRFSGSAWQSNNNGYTNVALNAGGLDTATNQYSNYNNAVGVGLGGSTSGSTFTPALNTTYLVLSKFTNVGTALSTGTPSVDTLWVLTQSGYNAWLASGANEANLATNAVATASKTVTSGTFNINGLFDTLINSGNFAYNNITATVDEFRSATQLALVTTGQDLLAENSFSLSLANGASMSGQAVSATGFTGNYNVTFAGNNQGQVGSATYTTTGLTFGSNFHPVSGGAVVVKAVSGTVNGAPAYEHLQATLSAAATGTVYSSYLISFSGSAWQSNNNGYTNVALIAGGLNTASNQYNNYNNAVGLGLGGSTSGSTFTPALNTTYLVLSKFTNVGVALSSTAPSVDSLWVLTQSGYDAWYASGANEANLAAYSVATAGTTVFGGTFNINGLFDALVNSGNFANNNITAIMDEFRVGTSLTAVTY